MKFLRGIITDKCRAIFPDPHDPAWRGPADRNDSPTKNQRVPKGVQGQTLGKKERRMK
jgi:hypothetical protein